MLRVIFKEQQSHIAKINFLNTRYWGSADGLSKRDDRNRRPATASSHMNAEVSEQIISCYKTGVSENRSRWIERLANDTLRYMASRQGVQMQALRQEALHQQATYALLNEMYDVLQACTYDFNNAMGWNGLRVTGTKPALVTEVLRYNKFREPVETVTHFRARFSTRQSSLVIRGSKDSVQFLILPVQEVIGLSRAESIYEPIFELKAVMVEGDIQWKVNDEDLSGQRLELLCMDLFSQLVDHSKVQELNS